MKRDGERERNREGGRETERGRSRDAKREEGRREGEGRMEKEEQALPGSCRFLVVGRGSGGAQVEMRFGAGEGEGEGEERERFSPLGFRTSGERASICAEIVILYPRPSALVARKRRFVSSRKPHFSRAFFFFFFLLRLLF